MIGKIDPIKPAQVDIFGKDLKPSGLCGNIKGPQLSLRSFLLKPYMN